MKEFFTSEKASEGNKVPLYLPNGEESKHWFIVRGSDSPEFRLADAMAKRESLGVAEIKEAKLQAEFLQDVERKTIASLVADWSFEEKCTQENVIAFLKKAPQVADAINRYAGNRMNFFAKRSQTSTNGTKGK